MYLRDMHNKWPQQKTLLAMKIDCVINDSGASQGTISRTYENYYIHSLYLLWSGFFAPHSGATIYNSNGSAANIQSIHDTQAVDGDTITLPAGTFSWTTHVDITKGITLQGQTAISGAGTSNPVIADNTIVQDNSNHRTNQLGLVRVTLNPTQSFRLTGITFTHGSATLPGTTEPFE